MHRARAACVLSYLLKELHCTTTFCDTSSVIRSLALSDGLIEDVGKLGALANSAVKLSSKDVPLSKNAKLLIEDKKFFLKDFLTAGDDYQLAFTFNKKKLN